jgi:uncharacterized protein (TIRG00374 family)
MDSPPKPLRGRLFAILRIGLALSILAWVATRLPWDDELFYTTAAGTELHVQGTIEGEWKDDQVRFRAEDAELSAEWPAEAREATRRGESFEIVRHENGQPGFDWQPAMPRAFREMEPGRLLGALALFFVATLVIVTRWWRLLELAGCPTTWRNAARLTFVGLFFNNVTPGATGGDLVKGVVVAKENPGRRAEALVTVLADRVFGLIALALLAFVVILFSGGPFVALRTSLLVLIGVCVVGIALYSNRALRKKIGLSALVDRLPIGDKLRSLDRAALVYLRRPGPVALAFAFSFLNHVLVVLGAYYLGGATGVPRSEVDLVQYFVLVPVANLIGALPLAPGGWGVGELAFSGLFKMIGASPTLGVAVSVTYRLCQLAIGLLGGVMLLMPGGRSAVRAAEAASASEELTPTGGPSAMNPRP